MRVLKSVVVACCAFLLLTGCDTAPPLTDAQVIEVQKSCDKQNLRLHLRNTANLSEAKCEAEPDDEAVRNKTAFTVELQSRYERCVSLGKALVVRKPQYSKEVLTNCE